MKKILVLMILSLVGFNAFGCESIFDSVKGMTCEIECILCADRNIDIKLCDNVKERYEQYEEDFTIANEKCSTAKKAAKELEIKAEALKKELDVNPKASGKIVKLLREANDLIKVARDAAEVSNAVFTNFLGEENLMLLQNADFVNEVSKVLGE